MPQGSTRFGGIIRGSCWTKIPCIMRKHFNSNAVMPALKFAKNSLQSSFVQTEVDDMVTKRWTNQANYEPKVGLFAMQR